MAEMAPAHGVRWRFVSFPDRPYGTSAAAGGGVCATIRAHRPDVVLLDSIAAAHMAPWLIRRPLPVPLVAILHQPPGGIDHGPLRTRVLARLDLSAYRHAVRLVAASTALAEQAVAAGLPAHDLVVVAPGRDVASGAGDPDHDHGAAGHDTADHEHDTADHEHGAAGTGAAADLRAGRRVALLCVANWVERKGILDLLAAVERLPTDAATLHLVGDDRADPRYARAVRERLARPALADRVVVHGPVPRERVAALYRAADVFVLASTREPYGTVYGEAMASGLPVVGWDAGNLPNLARNGHEGVAVPPGDVAALATALRRLVDDDAWRRRMAEAARRRAAAFPTWRDSAALLFTTLREAAAQPGTARPGETQPGAVAPAQRPGAAT